METKKILTNFLIIFPIAIGLLFINAAVFMYFWNTFVIEFGAETINIFMATAFMTVGYSITRKKFKEQDKINLASPYCLDEFFNFAVQSIFDSSVLFLFFYFLSFGV